MRKAEFTISMWTPPGNRRLIVVGVRRRFLPTGVNTQMGAYDMRWSRAGMVAVVVVGVALACDKSAQSAKDEASTNAAGAGGRAEVMYSRSPAEEKSITA